MSTSDANPLRAMLRKLTLWSRLSEEDRAALLDLPYTRSTMAGGGTIVSEGARVERSCLLVSGFAFRSKVVATGGRQILALHVPGDMIDLQNALLHVADHNVQALTEVDLAFIPREAILALAFDRPTVGRALWLDTLVDGAIHREWTTNIGRRDGRTRIAHLLCEFGMRLRATGVGMLDRYDIPMSQEQLADALGLTSVHVNRMLMLLAREGFIHRDKRAIVILDWKGLAQAGDFDGSYLHLPDELGRMG